MEAPPTARPTPHTGARRIARRTARKLRLAVCRTESAAAAAGALGAATAGVADTMARAVHAVTKVQRVFRGRRGRQRAAQWRAEVEAEETALRKTWGGRRKLKKKKKKQKRALEGKATSGACLIM